MKLRIYLCIIVFAVFVSCRRDAGKVVLTEAVQNSLEQNDKQYDYLAIMYIDIQSCTSCALHNLSVWVKHIPVLSKYKTEMLFIICHPDTKLVMEILETVGKFNVVFDSDRKFRNANNAVLMSAIDNIFIIDKNNSIIFNESPIKNEETWNKFVKLVKN